MTDHPVRDTALNYRAELEHLLAAADVWASSIQPGISWQEESLRHATGKALTARYRLRELLAVADHARAIGQEIEP